MKVIVEARHFKAREALQKSTEKEVNRLEKFFDRIVSADVILDGKLNKKEATVRVKVPDQTLIASETADKFEIAVESAVDKLEIQLKKYKEKLRKR